VILVLAASPEAPAGKPAVQSGVEQPPQARQVRQSRLPLLSRQFLPWNGKGMGSDV